MLFLWTLIFFVAFVSSDLNFLAIGDWGGASDKNPTTKNQIDNAAGMGHVADKLNIDFATLLGDNFYVDGINSGVTCPRFESTFENVYTAKSLQVPFYAIAGNHDHHGNVTAQIAYTNISKRWKYPAPWYGIQHTFDTSDGSKSLEIFFIDTVIISGNSDDNEKNGLGKWDQPIPPVDQAPADAQWDWLNQSMASSTADYLWVAGHYPVWSACSHGPTSKLVEKLKPMLEKHNAHYMCGHDHCMGHIDEGTGVQYILTGAGKACCYDPSKASKNPKGSIKWWMAGKGGSGYQPMPFPMESGFTSFRIDADAMKIVFHAHNGTEIYAVPDIKPREI